MHEALSCKLEMSETNVIHLALAQLVAEMRPAYELDNAAGNLQLLEKST